MASLYGVVEAWDDSAGLRERMRVHRCLFVPANRQAEAKASVECADKNFDALKPLVERLEHNGEVCMFMVPALMKTIFSGYYFKCFLLL